LKSNANIRISLKLCDSLWPDVLKEEFEGLPRLTRGLSIEDILTQAQDFWGEHRILGRTKHGCGCEKTTNTNGNWSA
jgi:hypothetical protein